MSARLRGHKQRKLNAMFIHFFPLCPLGLTIKLNFNISKVAYESLVIWRHREKARTGVKAGEPGKAVSLERGGKVWHYSKSFSRIRRFATVELQICAFKMAR